MSDNQNRNGENILDWQHEIAFETLAVRAGQQRGIEGEHSEAIFPTSSYVYQSAAQAAARFSGEEPGNIYSRFTNPTVRMFEQRLAALENAQACVATSSGMSAILSCCLALLKSGDEIISSRGIFGATTVLFDKYLSKFGITVSYVDANDFTQWENAISDKTKLFFLESPTNPLLEVIDIKILSELAKKNNALLLVDNCLATPAIQKPLDLGADLVVHSATKYIDGQGRAIGGAVLGAKQYIDEIFGVIRTAGPSLSPFNAWIFLKGLETLSLRMQKHSENALAVAQWLEQQQAVEKVYYPGLKSHPNHEIAKRQQQMFGGVVSFSLKGGQEQAWKCIDSTHLFSITANLGDSKSIITHPYTTTHGRVSVEEKQKMGITPRLIRLSIGLENLNDIIDDLSSAIAATID